MNVIVKHHYPAAKLPSDLKVGLPEDATVRIEISREPAPTSYNLAALVGSGAVLHGDESSVLKEIAVGRDDR